MFRHRVSFEEPVESQDPYSGAVEVTWGTVFANVPAAIEFRSVRESVGGAQMQVTTVGTVTIRWRPGLTAKQRIVWATEDGIRVFNISGLVTDKYTNDSIVEIPVSELL